MLFALIALLAAAPWPAIAAGGLDVPFYVGFPLAYLFLAGPALMLGWMLGRFLKVTASLLTLLILALAPTTLVLAMRGVERALTLGVAPFYLLLIFSPVIAFGWHVGRKHAARDTHPPTLAHGTGN